MALAAMRVTVVGGSIAGLFAALALRHAGCDVNVFERSDGDALDRGAGLVVHQEMMRHLAECGLTPVEPPVVESLERQYVDGSGEVMSRQPVVQRMTSWGALWRLLRRAFPDALYHAGRRVTGIAQRRRWASVELDPGQAHETDLVVGADGANSTVRREVLPGVEPEYAGYVAWRGVLPETALAGEAASLLTGRLSFFQGDAAQFLCYLIPGPDGAVEPQRRLWNWVWYRRVAAGVELQQLLTDRHGLVRDYALPPGSAAPAAIAQLRHCAEALLPPAAATLVLATAQPFVQPVYDLAVPRMACGRVALLGDAAFLARPHAASGVSKALSNSLALARSITRYPHDVEAALREWEPAQLETGRHFRTLGRRLGHHLGLS